MTFWILNLNQISQRIVRIIKTYLRFCICPKNPKKRSRPFALQCLISHDPLVEQIGMKGLIGWNLIHIYMYTQLDIGYGGTLLLDISPEGDLSSWWIVNRKLKPTPPWILHVFTMHIHAYMHNRLTVECECRSLKTQLGALDSPSCHNPSLNTSYHIGKFYIPPYTSPTTHSS